MGRLVVLVAVAAHLVAAVLEIRHPQAQAKEIMAVLAAILVVLTMVLVAVVAQVQ
jgi:hypothetical protein